MDKSTLLLLLLIAAAGGGYYTYKNSADFRNKVDSLMNSFCKKACTGCGDHCAVKPESTNSGATSVEADKAKAALVPPAPIAPDVHPAPAPMAKAPAAPVMAHPTPAPKPALVHPAPMAKVPVAPAAKAPTPAVRPA